VVDVPTARNEKALPDSKRRLVLDPAIQNLLDRLTRTEQISPHAHQVLDARVALSELQKYPFGVMQTEVEELALLAGPAGKIGIRIVRPPEGEELPPVVLYLHGGCWVMGDADIYDRLIRELANGAHAAIVFVEYTLAPEARYPIQIEQAYAVLEYIVRDADALRLDASRVVVAGDCAGGNMAAAIALLAKLRRGPEIAFQLLLYPVLAEPEMSEPEADETVPWLTHADLRRHIDDAFPQGMPRQEPTAFPLNASLQQLNDLPDALVIVAEHDITRDSGEEYARRMTEAGVTVTCTRYNGAMHDFLMLNALTDAAMVRSARAQAIQALYGALHGC
jgi:acetyl esterase